MKIRIGFVSNSSSCSFCIYGVEIGEKEFDAIESLKGLTDSISDNPDSFCDEVTYIIGISAYDVVANKTKTIGQVEKETIEKIEKALGRKIDSVSMYHNGWYNG